MKTTTETTVAQVNALIDEANETGKAVYYKTAAMEHPLRVITSKYPWKKGKKGLPPERDKSQLLICTTSNAQPWVVMEAGADIYIQS